MCTRGTRWRDYAIFCETISYIALKWCLSKSTGRDRESPAEREKSTKLEIIIFDSCAILGVRGELLYLECYYVGVIIILLDGPSGQYSIIHMYIHTLSFHCSV